MKSTYYCVLLVASLTLMETACREKQSESASTTQEQPPSATTGQPESKSAVNEPVSKRANEAVKEPATEAVKEVRPEVAADSASASRKTDPKDTGAQSSARPAQTTTTPEAKDAPSTSSATKDKTTVIKKPAVEPEATKTTSKAPEPETVKRIPPVRISATIPGSTSGAPLPENPKEYSRRFPGTERGLNTLLAYFVSDGIDIVEATQLLRPDNDDYPTVFLDDFAERAELYYEEIWSSERFALYGFVPGAKFTMSKVTTQELREKTSAVARKWPQGYNKVIHYFNEDMTLYRVMIQSPISTLITPVDFFVHVNDHWTVFPRSYLVLRFTSPPAE